MKRLRLEDPDEWDGVCACGKAAQDGVRCKYGATHAPPPRRRLPERRAPIKRERLDLFDDED